MRGTLDRAQSDKIKSAVVEVVDDLVDQKDETAPGETPSDAEAAAAIETTDVAISDLPVLKSEELAPEWQADTPVLCVAGRGPVDEAAAIMLAQLLEKHGLRARVVSADAIAISNISPLETSGIVMVCLSYLDTGSPAHMRYAIRRLRRKLPQAQILLGCWVADVDRETLRNNAKADAIATTLKDAVRLCLDAAGNSRDRGSPASKRLMALAGQPSVASQPRAEAPN
jgi:hypothetical protein